MKAVRLKAPGGLENIEIVELPDPGQPGPGDIRVRVHATSLNYHDLGVASGRMPTADGRILMSDGAGVVEAVGPGVQKFAVGDRVVSTFFPTWLDGPPTYGDFSTVPGDGVDGLAAEVVVRPWSAFTFAPDGYSHAEAATLTTAGVTAWRALIVNGSLKPGEAVLVMGTGGVSIFALQIAQSIGAVVTATSSSDEKLDRLRVLGAAHLINYRSEPEWGKKVRQMTGGRGVDHVVEVGGSGTLTQSITAARVGGHISMIGVLTGTAGHAQSGGIVVRQQRVEGLLVGSRRHQQDFVRALNTSGIRPVIDRVMPLERIADAFRLQQAGGHFGKICLEY